MIYEWRVGFLDIKALSLKDELERDEINKLIDYIKPLMNNATDRNTFKINNFQFYFNKHFTSRGIKIQNDFLTKGTFTADVLGVALYLGGILGMCFMIYIHISPNTTVKTAALVAVGASNILNKTNTLINYGYGTPSEYMNEETGTLNKKSLEDLKDLYENNQKFRDEIMNFVGGKA